MLAANNFGVLLKEFRTKVNIKVSYKRHKSKLATKTHKRHIMISKGMRD
jgi:hypothetical protein